MENVYLTTKKISEMTGLRSELIAEWCRKGKLKAYQPCGKTYLVKREDFEAFMEESKVQP